MPFRCGGIFNDQFITQALLSLMVTDKFVNVALLRYCPTLKRRIQAEDVLALCKGVHLYSVKSPGKIIFVVLEL